jgi:hypothetical protein
VVAFGQEAIGQIRPDETRYAGDDDAFAHGLALPTVLAGSSAIDLVAGRLIR